MVSRLVEGSFGCLPRLYRLSLRSYSLRHNPTQSTYVQVALSCQERFTDEVLSQTCERVETGHRCDHCTGNNKPCTASPEELVLNRVGSRFATHTVELLHQRHHRLLDERACNLP